MPRTMPHIEARNTLSPLPETFAQEPELDAIAMTRRGQPVLAVMPWALYDALVETLDILGDADAMEALRQSLGELEEGQLIPWETTDADPPSARAMCICCNTVNGLLSRPRTWLHSVRRAAHDQSRL